MRFLLIACECASVTTIPATMLGDDVSNGLAMGKSSLPNTEWLLRCSSIEKQMKNSPGKKGKIENHDDGCNGESKKQTCDAVKTSFNLRAFY